MPRWVMAKIIQFYERQESKTKCKSVPVGQRANVITFPAAEARYQLIRDESSARRALHRVHDFARQLRSLSSQLEKSDEF
jgi:hypothetical protein